MLQHRRASGSSVDPLILIPTLIMGSRMTHALAHLARRCSFILFHDFDCRRRINPEMGVFVPENRPSINRQQGNSKFGRSVPEGSSLQRGLPGWNCNEDVAVYLPQVSHVYIRPFYTLSGGNLHLNEWEGAIFRWIFRLFRS